ncbi:MAG: hypothetical protein WBA74_19650, partial [Cyclobacteriaceae bacterium]
YSNALYYLNVYFKETLDKKALSKIEELADRKQLRGYADAETAYYNELFFSYYKYGIAFILVMLSLAILFAARHTARGNNPVVLIILLILLLPAAFAFNFDFEGQEAIVINEVTYFMDGPSGSANVALTLSKGHKLTIKETQGVWAKVVWNDDTFYVRRSNLKQLI